MLALGTVLIIKVLLVLSVNEKVVGVVLLSLFPAVVHSQLEELRGLLTDVILVCVV